AVLDKSEANLREFRDSPPPPPGADPRKQLGLRIAASELKRQFSPEELRDNLTAVTEATVVANTVLENAGELPIDPGANLTADRLSKLPARLTEAGNLTQELSAMFDDEAPNGATPAAMRDRTSRIEDALATVHAATRDFQSEVDRFANREKVLKARFETWL